MAKAAFTIGSTLYFFVRSILYLRISRHLIDSDEAKTGIHDLFKPLRGADTHKEEIDLPSVVSMSGFSRDVMFTASRTT